MRPTSIDSGQAHASDTQISDLHGQQQVSLSRLDQERDHLTFDGE
jgi:hypothetical protein